MLSAIGDAGRPVDWWFLYKVPRAARAAAGTGTPASGYEYAYFDSSSRALAGSTHRLNDGSNALHRTLDQLPARGHPSCGVVFYNDEYPSAFHKSNDDDRGHCKACSRSICPATAPSGSCTRRRGCPLQALLVFPLTSWTTGRRSCASR